MTTTWAEHVAKFAKKNNIDLGDAMKNKKCKKEWKEIKKVGGLGGEDGEDGEQKPGQNTGSHSSDGETPNPQVVPVTTSADATSADATSAVTTSADANKPLMGGSELLPTQTPVVGGARRSRRVKGGKKSKQMLRKTMKLKNKSLKNRKANK